MMRTRLLSALLLLTAGSMFAAPAIAQAGTYEKFLAGFNQGRKFNDEKEIQKSVRSDPYWALYHLSLVGPQAIAGSAADLETTEIIQKAFKTAFPDSSAADNMIRRARRLDRDMAKRERNYATSLNKCYAARDDLAQMNTREAYLNVTDASKKTAESFEQIGNALRGADTWLLVTQLTMNIPERSTEDQQMTIYALQRFMALRQQLDFTFGTNYDQSQNLLKSEQERLKVAEDNRDKLKDAGFDPNAQGVDALLDPAVEPTVHDLKFEMQSAVPSDDVFAFGGPLPSRWMVGVLAGNGSSSHLPWFNSQPIYMTRDGASDFGISINANSPNDDTQEIKPSGKPKPSKFFLDADKKKPYAMWFFQGSDKERHFQLEANLAPSTDYATIGYLSAASWTTEIAGERVTFYDDNSNGKLFESDPFELGLKVYTAGNTRDGTSVPSLDSMRVGKRGKRVPFSQFVQIGEQWLYLELAKDGTAVQSRPFHAEFLKTGTLKLDWDGSKSTSPDSLIVRGRGALSAAMFDVSSGKAINVPVGEYELISGRILNGKGARLQHAGIAPGTAEPTLVEEGKEGVIEAGAPFTISFERSPVEDGHVLVDGTTLAVKDRSGLVLYGLFNTVLVPEVLESKDASGKGARVVGEFAAMTDPTLYDQATRNAANGVAGSGLAAYPMPAGMKEGDMKLKVPVKSDEALIGLRVKKNPLFGKLQSPFK